MRKIVFAAFVALTPLSVNAMTIGSATFKPEGRLPVSTVYNTAGCNGQNRSPELHWNGAPVRTKSFALVLHDPDAPVPGGFDHWFAYNIASSTHGFAEGVKLRPDQLGVSGFGKAEYDGPCPPPGKAHRYVFTLYALDIAHIGNGGMGGRDLAHALRGHILASAHVTGIYGRSAQ